MPILWTLNWVKRKGARVAVCALCDQVMVRADPGPRAMNDLMRAHRATCTGARPPPAATTRPTRG